MSGVDPACRHCGATLSNTLVDLGFTPLANSYLTAAQVAAGDEKSYPLHARVCASCFLVQVDNVVPASDIFSDYAYFSSYSDTWIAHAKAYADKMIHRMNLNHRSLVIEVASNDGYLLRHFVSENIPVLGIEPAANVAEAAVRNGVPSRVAFFGEALGRDLANNAFKADLIAANNVFAHVPDINDFVRGFVHVLKPEGILTFEFPHLLNLIEQVQFDTIYHEHYSYLSLLAAKRILERSGLRVFDVEEIATHGGSLRLFVGHTASMHQETEALRGLERREIHAKLDTLEGYQGFAPRVNAVRTGLRQFLLEAKSSGKSVAGYGAAAKGNTMLNFCRIGSDLVKYVVDRNPAKQNVYLPGSHIPVFPIEWLDRTRPDYILILPWNLASEIGSRMSHVRAWGAQFVVAVPQLRVF